MLTEIYYQEPNSYQRGIQRIFGRIIGNIYLVPSEATCTILQLSPNISISCILPPTTRSVSAEYEKHGPEKPINFDLQTPELLWRQTISWGKCSNSYWHRCISCQPSNCSTFHLLTVGSVNYESKILETSGYQITNIDNTGYICWGSIANPSNMRQANFKFWQSTLNNSMGYYRIDGDNKNTKFIERLKNYKVTYYDDSYDLIAGNISIKIPQKITGIFISLDKQLINKFSDYKISRKGLDGIIGVATRNHKTGDWYIDLVQNEKKNCSIILTETQVKLI